MNRQEAITALLAHFDGSQTLTAESLRVSQPTVNGWVKGLHGMRAGTAIRAEHVTAGAVKAVDLCPELKEPDAA